MTGKRVFSSNLRTWRVVKMLLLVAVLLGGGLSLTAHSQQQLPTETAAPKSDAAPESTPSDPEKQAELRQQSAVAGLLVLALLCVIFLTLMIGVVLWARRMRKLTNRPLPDQHPGDPLWYLRKPVAKADDGGSDD